MIDYDQFGWILNLKSIKSLKLFHIVKNHTYIQVQKCKYQHFIQTLNNVIYVLVVLLVSMQKVRYTPTICMEHILLEIIFIIKQIMDKFTTAVKNT